MPNAGGAFGSAVWALGFGKVPPKFLCHHFAHAPLHYTVHESCFDAICIVRIRLLAIVIIVVFASTLYNFGINDDGMDY